MRHEYLVTKSLFISAIKSTPQLAKATVTTAKEHITPEIIVARSQIATFLTKAANRIAPKQVVVGSNVIFTPPET